MSASLTSTTNVSFVPPSASGGVPPTGVSSGQFRQALHQAMPHLGNGLGRGGDHATTREINRLNDAAQTLKAQTQTGTVQMQALQSGQALIGDAERLVGGRTGTAGERRELTRELGALSREKLGSAAMSTTIGHIVDTLERLGRDTPGTEGAQTGSPGAGDGSGPGPDGVTPDGTMTTSPTAGADGAAPSEADSGADSGADTAAAGVTPPSNSAHDPSTGVTTSWDPNIPDAAPGGTVTSSAGGGSNGLSMDANGGIQTGSDPNAPAAPPGYAWTTQSQNGQFWSVLTPIPSATPGSAASAATPADTTAAPDVTSTSNSSYDPSTGVTASWDPNVPGAACTPGLNGSGPGSPLVIPGQAGAQAGLPSDGAPAAYQQALSDLGFLTSANQPAVTSDVLVGTSGALAGSAGGGLPLATPPGSQPGAAQNDIVTSPDPVVQPYQAIFQQQAENQGKAGGQAGVPSDGAPAAYQQALSDLGYLTSANKAAAGDGGTGQLAPSNPLTAQVSDLIAATNNPHRSGLNATLRNLESDLFSLSAQLANISPGIGHALQDLIGTVRGAVNGTTPLPTATGDAATNLNGLVRNVEAATGGTFVMKGSLKAAVSDLDRLTAMDERQTTTRA